MMTVKINTKDGQIELTDEVIATVVGGGRNGQQKCDQR